MIIVPGFLIAAITFPGVIVHESAHLLFCKLRHVAVIKVCFFRFGNPAGFVLHEPAKDFTSAFLIAVGPFIVNSLLCLLFCFPAFVPVRIFGKEDLLCYFLLWLGVSIGAHAFPSTQDANVLWREAREAAKRFNLLAILSLPLVVVIYAANLLSFFWADVLYGLAIGLGLPDLVFRNVL